MKFALEFIAVISFVAFGIFASMLFAGCFQAAGQPFPTATQMLAACEAEKAAGTPQAKAPDCMSYWVVSQGCGIQAVANAVNPIVIPVATAGNPLAGSLIAAGASLDTAVCKQQGFLQ